MSSTQMLNLDPLTALSRLLNGLEQQRGRQISVISIYGLRYGGVVTEVGRSMSTALFGQVACWAIRAPRMVMIPSDLAAEKARTHHVEPLSPLEAVVLNIWPSIPESPCRGLLSVPNTVPIAMDSQCDKSAMRLFLWTLPSLQTTKRQAFSHRCTFCRKLRLGQDVHNALECHHKQWPFVRTDRHRRKKG